MHLLNFALPFVIKFQMLLPVEFAVEICIASCVEISRSLCQMQEDFTLSKVCVLHGSCRACAAPEICIAKWQKISYCTETVCKVILTGLMRLSKSAWPDLLKFEVHGGFLLCRESASCDIRTADVA